MDDLDSEFKTKFLPPSELTQRLSQQRTHALMPSTYSAESVLQLDKPMALDITDRSLVRRAEYYGFDPAGYTEDNEILRSRSSPALTRLPSTLGKVPRGPSVGLPSNALRRSVFYTSPFLTCQECNALVFVDASAVRSGLHLRDRAGLGGAGTFLRPEALPACHNCGSTAAWMVGADDLTDVIQASKEEIQRRLRETKRAVRTIQRFYRKYLKRRAGRAFLDAGVIRNLLLSRAATTIAALGRGRLGRRTYWTEKALKTIKGAHPMLIQYAFTKKAGAKKVFWYRTQGELDVLYEDYRVLVERTGHVPPRLVVEENIKEIARRVLARQNYLAVRVQKRFRGVSVRRYLKIYRREKMWLRSWQNANAFVVQRNYRAWIDRKIPSKIRLQNKLNAEGEKYRREKQAKLREQGRTELMKQVLGFYQRERDEEQTARFMGKVKPDGRRGKMVAFARSGLCPPRLARGMAELHAGLRGEAAAEGARRRGERERNDFVASKLEDGNSAWVGYYGQEMKEYKEMVMERILKEKPKSDLLRQMKEHNGRKVQYQFPADIYSDPSAILHERIIPKNRRRLKDQPVVKDIGGKGGYDKNNNNNNNKGMLITGVGHNLNNKNTGKTEKQLLPIASQPPSSQKVVMQPSSVVEVLSEHKSKKKKKKKKHKTKWLSTTLPAPEMHTPTLDVIL